MKILHSSRFIQGAIRWLVAIFGLVAFFCLFFLSWGAPSGVLALTLLGSLLAIGGLLAFARYFESKSGKQAGKKAAGTK
jgi:uncharacterized membrane protein HdeD (DUF308 family)